MILEQLELAILIISDGGIAVCVCVCGRDRDTEIGTEIEREEDLVCASEGISWHPPISALLMNTCSGSVAQGEPYGR